MRAYGLRAFLVGSTGATLTGLVPEARSRRPIHNQPNGAPMHAPFRGCKQWLSIMLIPDIVSRVLDVVGKHLGEFWPYRDGALTPYAVFETAAAVRSMSNLQAIVLESTSETSSAWAEPSRVPVSHSSAIKACSIEA